MSYKFRNGPVPNTGRWTYGRWYRCPRTYQEKKHAQNLEEFLFHGGRIRPKRAIRNLPDSWDDKQICRQRNWKKQRKTQWR